MNEAILILSFGGPEEREDVIPFLENVLRGRNVPRQRMLEVAEHYYHFGGTSPINDQNRALVAALERLLREQGPDLTVYWGNRNWHPFLEDTVRQMAADGIARAYAFATSAFSSYSGCRQYLENIVNVRAIIGPAAPEILKLRVFYNHPGFIGAMADRVAAAIAQIPAERRESAALVYTAHSVPLSMAMASRYVPQLEEACRLVSAEACRLEYSLVYQSRSGPPTQPWLEPDILSYLREIATVGGTRDVIVVPIGFVSDHLEVLYDLDVEARALAQELGLNLVRAGTAGTHPKYVEMIRDLVMERRSKLPEKAGQIGAWPDMCPLDCCPPPLRP